MRTSSVLRASSVAVHPCRDVSTHAALVNASSAAGTSELWKGGSSQCRPQRPPTPSPAHLPSARGLLHVTPPPPNDRGSSSRLPPRTRILRHSTKTSLLEDGEAIANLMITHTPPKDPDSHPQRVPSPHSLPPSCANRTVPRSASPSVRTPATAG